MILFYVIVDLFHTPWTLVHTPWTRSTPCGFRFTLRGIRSAPRGFRFTPRGIRSAPRGLRSTRSVQTYSKLHPQFIEASGLSSVLTLGHVTIGVSHGSRGQQDRYFQARSSSSPCGNVVIRIPLHRPFLRLSFTTFFTSSRQPWPANLYRTPQSFT